MNTRVQVVTAVVATVQFMATIRRTTIMRHLRKMHPGFFLHRPRSQGGYLLDRNQAGTIQGSQVRKVFNEDIQNVMLLGVTPRNI